MSETEQNDRPQSPRRPLFRMVAIGSAALFLLSTAYQASWGQGGGGNYGGDDNGLSSGEIAAIAVGGVAGAYGLWLLLGAADDDDDDDAATEATYVPGHSSAGKATAVRLVSPTRKLAAGESAVFELQVQRGNQWVPVTNERNSSISVSGASLVRMDGAKNAFTVPMTAVSSTAEVGGRYTQPDGTVLTTHTTVNVGG